MKVTAKVQNPGDVQIAITIQMRLDEWQKLAEQLRAGPGATSHPSWSIAADVSQVISEIQHQVELDAVIRHP